MARSRNLVIRLKIVNRANLTADALAELEGQIPTGLSLDAVVKWTLSAKQPLKIAAVVTPDEFTHDIAINWHNGLVLVFGST